MEINPKSKRLYVALPPPDWCGCEKPANRRSPSLQVIEVLFTWVQDHYVDFSSNDQLHDALQRCIAVLAQSGWVKDSMRMKAGMCGLYVAAGGLCTEWGGREAAPIPMCCR
jgi:hypothetical protein